MYFRTLLFAQILLGLVLSACQNIGFVDTAKKIAQGKFGVDVFLLGPQAPGDFLFILPSGFPSSCSGLSGIERANCFCQATGDAQGRNREYRAWLSINSVVDAICNVQGLVTMGCSVPANIGPFQIEKPDSTPIIAWDYAELSTTGSRVALSDTPGLIWTGSTAAGRATNQDCDSWNTTGLNGTVGEASALGTAFSDRGTTETCITSATLLCVERIR